MDFDLKQVLDYEINDPELEQIFKQKMELRRVQIASYCDLLMSVEDKSIFKSNDLKRVLNDFIRTITETSSHHATAHFRTQAVVEQLEKCKNEEKSCKSKYHKYCSSHFSHEHIVPVNILRDLCLSLINNDISKEELVEVIMKCGARATITKEENAMLKNAGLNQKMPAEFEKPGDDLYMDPFARYKVELENGKNLFASLVPGPDF